MNNEPLVAESPDAGTAAPSLPQRVGMVFFSPGALGAALKRSAPWFWTLTIVAVVSTIIWFFLPQDLVRQTIEMQMAGRPRPEGQDIETAVRLARYTGTVGVFVMSFIAAAVIAGVLYLAFDVVMGQEATYKQHLSATAHIYWINLLGFLLLLPLWISKGDMQIKLGLGLLLAEAPASFLGHFLNNITIFGLWSSAALGAIESGLSGGRVRAGKAIGIILALYIVWAALSALPATLSGR
jgi:hypothetical protein